MGEPTLDRATNASAQLLDTYHSALQHDAVTLPPDTWIVGIVNKPMYGFNNVVHTNFPVLGPPTALFTTFKQQAAELSETELTDVEAHNTAWDHVNFADEYRNYLQTGWNNNTEVRTVIDRIINELDERSVALVCYEAAEKRCHRTILKQFIITKTPNNDN